jgi:hypothetical protein
MFSTGKREDIPKGPWGKNVREVETLGQIEQTPFFRGD